MTNPTMLQTALTEQGESLHGLSQKGPVLLVFLRHFGCVFCKEAMKDISKKRAEWEARGVNIVLVHMSKPSVAEPYFKKYGLNGINHISNEDCSLYQKFGLAKGTTSQLFGLKNWIRGFEVTVVKGTPLGLRQIGDGFQMPGIFLLRNGEIMDSYIHKSAADRPDYEDLISCCTA